MADEEVDVQFGAKIDQLIDGVQQVKNAIQSVNNTIQQGTNASADHANAVTGHMSQIRFALQGLTAPIRGIRENLGELAEAFIAGFAVEKIVEFVKEMADLGIQTQRTAAVLGISLEQADTLGGIARVTGSNIESLTQTIERLSLGVQRSTRDAFSPQAQALKVLGLNSKDLIGLKADEYFEKVVEAVGKFNPSLNLTNALTAVGGRGMSNLVATTVLAGSSFHDLKEQVERANKGIADAVPGMVAVHTSSSLLGSSLESLKAVIFNEFQPAINGIIKSLTDFVQAMRDSITEGGTFGKVMEGLVYIGKAVATAFASIVAIIRGLGEAASAIIDLTLGDIDKFQANAKQAAENFEKIGRDLKATLTTIWSTPVTIHPKSGLDAGAINEAARQAIEAQQTRIETEIALLKGELAQKKVLYEADAAQWKITDDKKFALTMEANTKEFQAEIEKLKQIQALWQGHPKEWEAIQKKIVQTTQQHNTEMIRLNAESVASMQAKWMEFLSGIQSAFNSQIRGLLARTTTFAQAFKNIMLDLVVFFIEQVEKMVVKWVAAQAAQVVASQSAEAAKTAATLAGEAAGLPVQIGHFVSSILADSALVFAGVFANLAPLMGPYAAAPAAAAQATVLAELANVPKFEVGTPYVPFTGLAMVHRGERIITAEDNSRGAGGTSLTIPIVAWDGASVMRWLTSGGGAGVLAKALAGHYKDNPTSRGKY